MRRLTRYSRRFKVHLLLALLVATGLPVAEIRGVTEAAADPVFNLTGSGWGHGLGMSQYGALGQAKEGRTYTAILRHYYQGSYVAGIPLPASIRVGILQNISSIDFYGSGGGYQIQVGASVWGTTAGQWHLEAISGGLRLRDPSGTSWDIGSSWARILGFEESGTQIWIAQANKTYGRGYIEVTKSSDTAFHVVVVTTYDKYLYGLGEMPSSWPVEALKAQAVAARTYALYKARTSGDHRPGCDCTVFASVQDQAYVGWSKEAGPSGAQWRTAVDATSSQVVLYGGNPILAVYHSSSGGYTEANEDVWSGSPLPYLRPVPDPWSQIPDNPYRQWSVSFTSGEIAAAFGMDTVFAIDLSRRTQGGGLAWAVLHGMQGGVATSKWIKGGAFRAALGLRSIKVYTQPEPGFDEWILLLNPNSSPTAATLSIQRAGQSPAEFRYDLPPNSRSSVRLNDLAPPGEIAVKVTSDLPIAAERAMYFGYRGWLGGHSSEGIKQPRTSWFLAEGYETDEFDTYIEVFNPQTSSTNVRFTLMRDDGYTQTVSVAIGPNWRYTLAPSTVTGFSFAAFSTSVEADIPVVVERSTYFRYRSPVSGEQRDGGAAAPALAQTSKEWHFAEGYSGPGFDTWVLLQNPTTTRAAVDVSFFVEGSTPKVTTVGVAPRSRATLLASTVPGVSGTSYAITLRSNVPIAAERAEYFNYHGITDGSVAEPTPAPRTKWYLTEGYSGPGFDTWVLLSNPLTDTAVVRATFMVQGGSPVIRDLSLRPLSRTTLNLGSIVGPVSASTVLESTNGQPFVAERTSYFYYSSPTGWKAKGGSASMGLDSLSTEWYFAEGYLR
ncbi:MAG: hypothetical protein C4318_08620 [Acidimicrobiia bacterium]